MEFDLNFWKKVADKSLAAIYITDDTGKVLYVNDIVEKFTTRRKFMQWTEFSCLLTRMIVNT